METTTLKSMASEICNMINVAMNPMSNNVNRLTANSKLNELLTNEYQNRNQHQYLQLAMLLIDQSAGGESNKSCGENIHLQDHMREMYMHYGFKLVHELIKYNWYQLELPLKQQLKQACEQWCTGELLYFNGTCTTVVTSTLVLNACSQCIVEIFIREYPTNWSNFIDNITKRCSLMTLYTLINVFDYLHTLLLPANANRRKDISKSLVKENIKIYDYLQRCLCISQSNEITERQFASQQYTQMIHLKCFEALQSLFEWFPLNRTIVFEVLRLSCQSLLSIDWTVSCKLQISAFQAVQALAKRSNSRFDDAELVNDLLHHCSSDRYLPQLCQMLHNFYMEQAPIVFTTEEPFQLFALVLELVVELICQVVALYNKSNTHISLRNSIDSNQAMWNTFLQLTLKLSDDNNSLIDQILLKFWQLFVKLHHREVSEEAIKLSASSCKQQLFAPFDLSSEIITRLLHSIGRFKIEPKSEKEVNEQELQVSYLLDEYISYQSLFNQNRSKYLHVLHELTHKQPTLCTIYMLNIFRDLLGPLPDGLQMQFTDYSTNIRSWNVLSVLSSAIIPRLVCQDQIRTTFELYFKRLLTECQISNHGEESRSYILSTLSSMSCLYSHFSPSLIQQLLEHIFELTIKCGINGDTQGKTSDLQNHAGALFIKLALNCSSLLLPFLDRMHAYIENLASSQLISSIQFCTLYEGLLVISNHMENCEHQESFIRQHVLSKIEWIVHYDFGPQGINFFTDIGLNCEPDFSKPQLPYFSREKFTQTFIAMTMLSRLLKRLDPCRLSESMFSALLGYLVPFYKLLAYFHDLWQLHKNNNQTALDQLCHSFYQQFLFEQYPNFYPHPICSEQSFLIPQDRLRLLLNQWDRQSIPSAELAGLHMQNRVFNFLSQTILMLSSSLNYMFFSYLNYPNSQAAVEVFLADALPTMLCSSKCLPLVMYYDLIHYYLRTLVLYCPRNEKLLHSGGIVNVLNNFMPMIFIKLDQQYQCLRQQKDSSLGQSTPIISSQALTIERSTGKPPNSKNTEVHNLEILMDFVHSTIGQEYIHLLRELFSDAKSIDTWASKFQNNETQRVKTEEDIMDEDEAMTNEEQQQTSSNSQVQTFSEDATLAKYLIEGDSSPMVIVTSNCLLWPVGKLRTSVSLINCILIRILLNRGALHTVEGFYYLAERVINALSLTEKSDIEEVNALISLFALLYEKVVIGFNLSTVVNPKLTQICNVELSMWNQYAQNCLQKPPLQEKRKMKHLKTLLDNIYLRATSSLHAAAKPAVFCFTTSPESYQPPTTESMPKDEEQGDTFCLSWLL